MDFYELKARLLEAGWDVGQAAEVVDAGRDLDHQDRYINNLATRLLMRAGREADARDRIAMFTRHEGDPERNLYDMQCVWYELELAECCRRKGDFGRSLRKYSEWYPSLFCSFALEEGLSRKIIRALLPPAHSTFLNAPPTTRFQWP